MDKKPLSAVVESMLQKERQKAVLALQRTADPEMDQELYIPGRTLHMLAKSMKSKTGRPSWMDGSDCDDADQHSRKHFGYEAESQLGPVITILFI
jgi:hypothetical protein